MAAKDFEFPKHVSVTSLGAKDAANQVAWSKDCSDDTQYVTQDDNIDLKFAWHFNPVVRKANTFRITTVGRNCEKRILSVSPACAVNAIEYTDEDEQTGRQHFTAQEVEGRPGVYTFHANGRSCPTLYLSLIPAQNQLRLSQVNTQENQMFQISEFQPFKSQDLGLVRNGLITSLGRTDEKHEVSAFDTACNHFLFVSDGSDNRFSNEWKFVKVEGIVNTYTI